MIVESSFISNNQIKMNQNLVIWCGRKSNSTHTPSKPKEKKGHVMLKVDGSIWWSGMKVEHPYHHKMQIDKDANVFWQVATMHQLSAQTLVFLHIKRYRAWKLKIPIHQYWTVTMYTHLTSRFTSHLMEQNGDMTHSS